MLLLKPKPLAQTNDHIIGNNRNRTCTMHQKTHCPTAELPPNKRLSVIQSSIWYLSSRHEPRTALTPNPPTYIQNLSIAADIRNLSFQHSQQNNGNPMATLPIKIFIGKDLTPIPPTVTIERYVTQIERPRKPTISTQIITLYLFIKPPSHHIGRNNKLKFKAKSTLLKKSSVQLTV